MNDPILTIGMACYDDFDGVYFTAQALRLYHPEVTLETEIVVVDNHPNSPASEALEELAKWIPGFRYIADGAVTGTAIRDRIFFYANAPYVLVLDCHVMLVAGAIRRLIDYFQWNPETRDLLQGPMLSDDIDQVQTHWTPHWESGMYGHWAIDERGQSPDSAPFDIPFQGLGLFACGKDAWPGFNDNFRGFGGEEGYIQEKFRRAGGRTLCLPFLRWLHRFGRPNGVPYPNRFEDRLHNYLTGWLELGWDIEPVKEHFATLLDPAVVDSIYWKALAHRTPGPLMPYRPTARPATIPLSKRT